MNDTKKEKIYSQDFHAKPILQGGGESYQCVPKTAHCYKIGDFEHTQRDYKFIDVVFDPPISGDSKPPQRILDSTSLRTSDQISAALEEKLRLSSIRRQIHINNIVQKSRLQNEKVVKVREKMASLKTENTSKIETELQNRKTTAEKARQKFLTDRVEKFRKQIEHAEAVKNKKNVNKFFSAIESQ